MYRILKRVLFAMEPERAHNFAISVLRTMPALPGHAAVARFLCPPPSEALKVKLFGLQFPHPIGLAAGLDKNGVAVRGLALCGFGHIEVGTVTPRPQPGNPTPRLFRLVEDRALINRFGFNNHGAAAMAAALQQVRPHPVPIGVNLGKNKETPNEMAWQDYVASLEQLAPHGDYFVINVSSPNTPGLRELQSETRMRELVGAVVNAAAGKPVLVKVAPDLDEAGLSATAAGALAGGAAGFIATNTTLARPDLRSPHAQEAGGLSGEPLFEHSTQVLATLYRLTGGQVPIIGVGGVLTGDDAYKKLRAGASLVQIYTGFIYQGPGAVRRIVERLLVLLERDGCSHVSQVVGVDSTKIPSI